jgi:hypothetical protein
MIPIKQILVGTINSILITNGSGIVGVIPTTTYLPVAGGTITGNILNSSTSFFQIPVGTTAQRPTAATGYLRYNTDTIRYEFGITGTGWVNHVRLAGDTMTGTLSTPAVDADSSLTLALGTTAATSILIGNTTTSRIGVGLASTVSSAILAIRASTSALTSINIAVGATVIAPNVGDIWVDNTDAYNIQGQLKTNRPMATGAMSLNKAKWKFGQYLTAAVSLDAAHYLEVEVDGVVYQLLISSTHT